MFLVRQEQLKVGLDSFGSGQVSFKIYQLVGFSVKTADVYFIANTAKMAETIRHVGLAGVILANSTGLRPRKLGDANDLRLRNSTHDFDTAGRLESKVSLCQSPYFCHNHSGTTLPSHQPLVAEFHHL